MKLVKFDKEEKYIKDFVKLAIQIYDSDDNMEDPDSIKKILKEEHPLSKYFSLANSSYTMTATTLKDVSVSLLMREIRQRISDFSSA